MTAAGWWTLGLALAYTAWLIIGGRRSVRAAASGRDGFFVGGRTFSPWTVAFCITGLFSGSSYIAIVELSYRTGISAVWYGVAETVQVLLIALLLVKPLRERLVVTVTGIIGDRFGRLAAGIGSIITGITFPMYSVATTIAFASALHAVTGLSLPLAVGVTALILLAFLAAGGMHAVAFSQTMNVIAIAAMLAVGGWALLATPGIGDVAARAAPKALDLGGAGVPLIAAWFGTFIVNVPLAQAAFQMSMSARTPEDGQRGLLRAAALGIPLILLGVVIGVVAAVVAPSDGPPLIAIASYIAGAVPPWAAGVFFLGLWACALGWAGPCQFSGATSLGRDLGRAIRPEASERELVRSTRIALVGLTALMVVFALLRTEQAAWWNIMAWTLRNGATLAPVLAAFLWPLATRRAAVAAMLAGFGSGMGWYALSGFQPSGFALGIHPVWIGMVANLATLVAATLAGSAWRLVPAGERRRRGLGDLVLAVLLVAAAAVGSPWLAPLGLVGPVALLATLAAFAAAVRLAAPIGAAPEEAPEGGRADAAHAAEGAAHRDAELASR